MQTGWIQVSGVYYYLDPSDGRMVAGTSRTIDGVTYQFAANGACNTNVNTNNVYNSSSSNNNTSSTPVVGGGSYSNYGPGVSSSGNSSATPGGGSTTPSGSGTTPGGSAPQRKSGEDLEAGLTGGPKP